MKSIGSIIAVVGFLVMAACGGSGSSTGPDDIMNPFVRVVALSPPEGSILSAGQTLHVTVEFGFPRENYPLEAWVMWWARSTTGQGSEGHGCGSTLYPAYASVHTHACDFTIPPWRYQMWVEDGVKDLTLEFIAYSKPDGGGGQPLVNMPITVNYSLLQPTP